MNSMIAGRQLAAERFRLAVDSYPGCMIMIDGTGIILLVNAEAERLFQYRRAEMIGQPVEILMPPRYRAEFPQYCKVFCDNLQPMARRGGFFGLRKDGTEIPVEIALNPIQMPDGGSVVLGAITDISDRKHNDDLKDEFVAMVSHELRTPMTSIAASLGLLIVDPAGKLSDAAMRLLRIAHNNSQRLVRLINSILDLAKIESGNAEFHIETLSVRPLVQQAIDCNRGFAEQFGVRVRLDDASTDGAVLADFDRLTQVIINLLSNAVKFSPRGGEVSIMIENSGANVRIAVRDHGPGIPDEFKSHVFERFAQGESSAVRKNGGSGLGLSIVKQIVVKLGGEVGFETVSGDGTIFYVDLPRCDQGPMTNVDPARETQIRGIA